MGKKLVKILIVALLLWVRRVIEYADLHSYLGVWNLVHFRLDRLVAPSVFESLFKLSDFLILVIVVVIVGCEYLYAESEAPKILYGLIVAGVCVSGILYIVPNYQDQASIVKMGKELKASGAIVHAGGFIQGSDGTVYDYTNTFDALQNAYESGNRVVEIDFWQTDADHLICYHPHENDLEMYGFDPQSEDDVYNKFMNTKAYGEFSTMSIIELSEYLRANPDLKIVTDVKGYNLGACELIAKNCPDILDQFIVQIYHDSEYELVRDLGFKYVILTLYRASNEELRIMEEEGMLDEHNLTALTFWADWVSDDTFYNEVKSLGMPLCIHTVNDVSEMKRYLDEGISCIYTDNTDNSWMKDFSEDTH